MATDEILIKGCIQCLQKMIIQQSNDVLPNCVKKFYLTMQ